MSSNQSKIIITGEDQTKSAFQSIIRNVTEINSKTKELQGSFSSLSGILKGGAGLLAGGAIFATISSQISTVVKDVNALGDELDNLSKKTGMSVDSLKGLSFVAKQSDVDLGTLGKGVKKFQQIILDASRGNEEAVSTIKNLGLNWQQLTKMTPEKAFFAFVDSLRQFKEEQRALVAGDVLGSKLSELSTLAQSSARDIEDLYTKGQKYNAFTAEGAALTAQFNDNLDELSAMFKMSAISIFQDFLPAANDFLKFFIRGKEELGTFTAAYQAFNNVIHDVPFIDQTKWIGDIKNVEQLNAKIDQTKKNINDLNSEYSNDAGIVKNIERQVKILEALEKQKKKLAETPITPKAPEGGRDYFGNGGNGGNKPPKSGSGSAGKSDATREFERQQAEARKALEATFDPLEKFNDELNKQFELYSKGLHTTDEYTKIVGYLSTKYYETSDSAKQFKKDQEEAAKALESSLSPAEKFQSDLTRLNQLYTDGHFSIDEYRKVVGNLSVEFMGAAKEAKPAFDKMEEYARQSARSIQSAFSDSIFNILSGNGNPFDNLKNTFLRVISEGMTMQLFEGFEKAFTSPKVGQNVGEQAANSFTNGVNRSGFFDVFANVFSSFTGSGSSSGSNILGSLISSVGSLFGSYTGGSTNNLSNVNSYRALPNNAGGFSTNFTALNDLNKSVRGGVSDGFKDLAKNNQYGSTYGLAPSQGNATAATIGNVASMVPVYGTAVAAAFTVFNALDKKYGDYKLNGAAKFGADGLDLALGGPILDAIGLASPVDLVAKFLFGRGPYKLRQQSFQGVLDEQGVTGDINTVYKSKGGLFLKNKTKEIRGEVPFEIENFIDSTVKRAFRDTRFTARNLGINADPLIGFNQSFQVLSDKKKALTDEQIKSVIDKFDDDLAKTLLPNVERFAQAGESASDTFKRIGQEFITLSNVGAMFGHSLVDTRKVLHSATIEQRTDLVDLMGGMEEFSNKASFFSENFLTDAERLAPMQERLSEEFKRLGLSTQTTKEQFRELVQSFGTAGGISGDLLAELLTLAPLFVQVNDGVAALNGTLENTVKTLDQLKSDVQAAYDRRSNELNGIKDQFKGILDNLKTFRQSLVQGSLSPLTPEQKLDEARTTLNRTLLSARNGNADAISDFPKVAEEFLAASQVFNASGAAYQSDFDLIKSMTDEMENLSKNQISDADKQLSKLNAQVSQLIDLNKNVQSVEDAIIALRDAIASGKGNASITDDEIRKVANDNSLTTAQKIGWADKNGVSDTQILKAVPGITATDLKGARNEAYGTRVTDKQIRDFVNANQNDLMAVYNAAVANGVSRFRLAEVMGWDVKDIEDWIRKNGVAMFEKGSDYIPRTGMALLHKGESVIPSNAMSIFKELIQEIRELRREQMGQTGDLISSSVESNIKNADVIADALFKNTRNTSYYNRNYKVAGMR